MSKNIFFLSASDRLNYGDLLFPLIFQELCKEQKNILFVNYAIVKSDLSSFGALPTRSYKRLLFDLRSNEASIVIGGGEVLFATWTTLYSFINPSFSRLIRSYKLRKLEDKYKIIRWVLSSGKVCFPFCPSKSELSSKNTRVFYNSVGGGFHGVNKDDEKAFLRNNLLESDYISVRDNRSYESLSENSVPSHLSPDSALIMSDLFPEEYLKRRMTLDDSMIPENYIFFQLGKNKSPEDVLEFSRKLSDLADILGCTIMLCPIGQAPGHEDHLILSIISKQSDKFQLVEPGNLYDIMFLIAKSKAYVGTSLHGLITAQSYNIPFIPLNKSVYKMDNYCKTWLSAFSQGCIDFRDIDSIGEVIENWDYEKMKIHTESQKSAVYSNFGNIFDLILK